MTRQERERRRMLVAIAVRRMEARGVNWSEWARERGFARSSVMKVVRGRAACLRGECYRIAVAMDAAIAEEPSDPPDRDAYLAGVLLASAQDVVELAGALEGLVALGERVVGRVPPGRLPEWEAALNRARRALERVSA